MATSPISTRPLYVQLRDALAERIATGTWKPGVAIANEGDLAREYGVSPGTMRKALDHLEGERLVTRRQGRGTFVNDQSSDEFALRFVNIRGPDGKRIRGDVELNEITAEVANEKECARLHLRSGDRVWRIRRVRLFEGKLFMLEEASLPAELFPGLEKMTSFTHRIVYLAQKHGILLGKGEERISIASASPEAANAFSVAPGSPLVLLDRVVRATDGRPVEWRIGWCQLANNYYLAQMH